jgi:hypothetical protein
MGDAAGRSATKADDRRLATGAFQGDLAASRRPHARERLEERVPTMSVETCEADDLPGADEFVEVATMFAQREPGDAEPLPRFKHDGFPLAGSAPSWPAAPRLSLRRGSARQQISDD